MPGERSGDDDPGDDDTSRNPGSAPRGLAGSAPRRVTLQFAGAPLALPVDALPIDDEEASVPEGGAPVPGSSATTADAAATTRRDEDRVGQDAWGRLRESGPSPVRARVVTPPLIARDDALALVSARSRPPSTPGLDLGREMSDRYALGDYTGALRVAELLLGRNPHDRKAQRCADGSRERLMQLYGARLGSLCAIEVDRVGEMVPTVAVPEHEIRWLGLDHRQGFLLSRLDGHATLDDLVDLSGMSRLEVLRTMVELLDAKAITFG